MSWMSPFALDIRVWDVTAGSAAYIRTGQRNVVLDCGATSNFSPAKWIRHEFGRTKIDYMIVSHPHHDHIEDLDQYKEQDLKPNIINRPKKAREIIESKLEEERENGNSEYVEDAEFYLELDNFSSDPDPSPTDPDWVGITDNSRVRADGGADRGVTFHNFGTKDPSLGSDDWETLNNLSKISVINSFGFQFVSLGDLLEDGIQSIMDKESVMTAIGNSEVLVAPHHGRIGSFDRELVQHINPDIVIFSDKGGVENTAVSEYGALANGKSVLNEETGSREERFVLTTRNDGRIRIEANNPRDWKASFFGKNYSNTIANSRKYQRIGRHN